MVVVRIIAVKIVAFRRMIVISVGHQIELERIEADDLETRTALVARDFVALFAFRIDINFFAAFGTIRCWHFYDLRKKVKILMIKII